MDEKNQFIIAMKLSKGMSLANWSYIGLLIPIVGIILAMMSQTTVSGLKNLSSDEKKEKSKVVTTSSVGFVLSVISLIIGIAFMNSLLNATDKVLTQ